MPASINILFISHSASNTGAPISLANLVTHLDYSIISPIVVAPNDGDIFAGLNAAGIPVIKIKKHEFKESHKYKLAWLALKHRAHLLHLSSIEAWPGCLAASMVKIPCIWQIHEMLDTYQTDKAKYLKLATQAVFVSQASASAAHPFLPEGKASVIYNGIDIGRFRGGNGRKIFEEFRLDPKSRIVLSIGSMLPVKGFDFLVQSIPEVLYEFPETKFFIVGDIYESSKKDVERLQSLCEARRIAHALFIVGPRSDIVDFLAAAQIVVSTSLTESFPLSLLEAMAASKPIIASRVGGIPEAVKDGETGILVQSKSIGELSNAIKRLLREPQLAASYGNAGFNRALEKFDVRIMADKFTDLYKKIVSFE